MLNMIIYVDGFWIFFLI